MNKHTLIQKIKSISDLTHEEQAELINLVNNTKKYGLVWEDKFEQIEEDLLTNLPVLTEVKERFIEAKPLAKKEGEEDLFSGTEADANDPLLSNDEAGVLGGVEAPNHILIEGDNLHALTALSFTHKGTIDVIYIDPPYNTGNNDFTYDDKFVDRDDQFRHSKWVSFIERRLQIAKSLLSDDGLIFISIDDNEQAQLKLLCDEIFSESNFIGIIVWFKKRKGSFLSNQLVSLTEYILPYRKKNPVKLFGGRPDNSESQPIIKRTNAQKILSFRNNLVRTKLKDGTYKSGKYGTGSSACTLQNDIIVKSGIIINDFELEAPFVWSQEFLDQEIENGTEILINTKNFQVRVIRKNNQSIKAMASYIDGREIGATNEDAYEFLSSMFNSDRPFSYSKPLNLVKSLILGATHERKDAIVLDFFAGSGTTLHATVQLNSEDGGKRQCILVTNNENNICEEVTYERNKRVIEGYTNAKGIAVDGLTNNNLRYYKCDYVPSAKTEANRRRLTEASTDLLCIKEDCYSDISKENGLNPKLCKLYTNNAGKYLAIVYHSRNQHEVNEQMSEVIAQLDDLQGKVKLYGFSPEIEVLLEDFYSVKDRVHAVPLPDAIYNAYRSTFKSINLGKRKSTDYNATESQAEETDLFNQATTEA